MSELWRFVYNKGHQSHVKLQVKSNATKISRESTPYITLTLYTFYSTIKNFSACCNTSRGIKLAASQADRLRLDCSLAIKRHDLCCRTALHVDSQMQICLNFKYMKLMPRIKLLLTVAVPHHINWLNVTQKILSLSDTEQLKIPPKALVFGRIPSWLSAHFPCCQTQSCKIPLGNLSWS